MAKKSFDDVDRNAGRKVTDVLQARYDRKGKISDVRLAEVAQNPRNPRYPDDPDVQSLADGMKVMGQLQPAVVVTRETYAAALPDDAAGLPTGARYVTIIGNRRLAAAHLADLDTLSVIVSEKIEDAATIIVATLQENLLRSDVPPFLEAQQLADLIRERNGTYRSIAEEIGKSHQYVKNRLDLLKLTVEAQALLRDGLLKVREAERLAKQPAGKQRAMVAAGPPYDPDLLDLIPELRAAVLADDLSAGVAKTIAALGPDRQREVVAAGPPYAADPVNPVYRATEPTTGAPADGAAASDEPVKVAYDDDLARDEESAGRGEPASRGLVEVLRFTVPVNAVDWADQLASQVREHFDAQEVALLIKALGGQTSSSGKH